MFDFSGRNVLITGASGDIGHAIAHSFHSHGAKIAISGRNETSLNNLVAELGKNTYAIPASLDNAENISNLFKSAMKTIGTIDILVNNAGITRDMLAMRMSNEDWSSVIQVNMTASFQLCRAVLRGMIKVRRGRIINITSVVGVTGNPGQANYAASKAGLLGMSKALALEVAQRGITVNCVAPGFISTAMTEKLSEQQKNLLLEKTPAGRLGKPEDVAACVTFLASDEASFITGQTLHVNGGLAMI
ncbi:MAG: beta-ketoacyl-ACP reductase [Rhodospirillaceae bacterium]|nr:beta-ketoacyl-ACP reductase [Rhodospirillaceae bacterium]|tara:strand:+ start:2977 stop:3714 length:738 start_codon:yes stop_codon:yes gene_type:complete